MGSPTKEKKAAFINTAEDFCCPGINSQLWIYLFSFRKKKSNSIIGLLFCACAYVRACVRDGRNGTLNKLGQYVLSRNSGLVCLCLSVCVCGWMNHWPCVRPCVCARHNRLPILWPPAYSEKTKTNPLLCTIDLGSGRQTLLFCCCYCSAFMINGLAPWFSFLETN